MNDNIIMTEDIKMAENQGYYNKTEGNKAGNNKEGNNKTGNIKAEKNKIEKSKTEKSKTEKSKTEKAEAGSGKGNSEILNRLSGIIMKLTAYFDSLRGRLPETVAFVLYVAGHCIVSLFHEPWFDEAQAWNIARDASLKEMLFEVTHYEGHPSLWHLVLSPFAKLGAPYELSLGIVSLIFSGLAVWILLYKSPFPRIVRLVLPFTYFFFYQYGVIARPYCMMLAAFMLLGVLYGKRNEKPVRYVAGLAFLCATGAYGLAIAGGTAIVWVIEIVRGHLERSGSGNSSPVKKLISDKRTWCLVILLLYAIFIGIRIAPRNTIALDVSKADGVNNVFVRLIYVFLALIPDLLITNSFGKYEFLYKMEFSCPELICSCVLGAALLAVIWYIGKKQKTRLLFFIPFVLFSVFSATVYICIHHTGTMLCFLVFWLWAGYGKGEELRTATFGKTDSDAAAQKGTAADATVQEKTDSGAPAVFSQIYVIICALSLIIPLVWNVMACVCDIRNDYAMSRSVYEFLDQNDYLDCSILCEGNVVFDEAGDVQYCDLKHCVDMVVLAPYNTELNFVNWQYDQSVYPLYTRDVTDEENQKILADIRAVGPADIIIGNQDLSYYYDGAVDERDYVLVFRSESGKIWKGLQGTVTKYVYLRKDLWSERN